VIQIIRLKHHIWKNHRTQFHNQPNIQGYNNNNSNNNNNTKGFKTKKITIKKTMIKIKGEPKKKNQSNKMIQKQNQRERVSKLK